MKISIETIAHKDQRYDTIGDWFYRKDETLCIKISEMNEDSELLVAIHELVEAYLCKKAGVTQEQVDEWDMPFKDFTGNYEPGDDPKAPYHRQHTLAMATERFLCALFDLKWDEHERNCNAVQHNSTSQGEVSSGTDVSGIDS